MKHFKLTSETVQHNGRTLHRIQATKDSLHVKKGELGGFVESLDNLSDNAWVSGNAQVSGDAKVSGNAWVYGDARVYGDAKVFDNARVFDNAWVSGSALVYGNAKVSDDAWVFGNAGVFGDAKVSGNARVSDNAWVSGSSKQTELQLQKGEFYWIKLSRSSEWIPAECTCEVDGCFTLGDKGFWTVDEIFEYKHEPIEKP